MFLHTRLWCWLSKWRGNCLSACRVASPDETSIIFIEHRVREKQLVLQVFEVVVIKVKASFQRTIGYPSLAFEQCECLVQDLLKGHRPPSLRRSGVQQTVWEWEKPVGLVIPQMGDKRKPQSWQRVTAPCHGACRRGGDPRAASRPLTWH